MKKETLFNLIVALSTSFLLGANGIYITDINWWFIGIPTVTILHLMYKGLKD